MRSVTTAGLLLCLLIPGIPDALGAPAPDAQSAAKVDRAALLKAARTMEWRVAKLRGLRLRRKVKMALLSPDEMRAQLREGMARRHRAEELRGRQAVLRRLWLLPAGQDLGEALAARLTARPVTHYDPHKRRLNIAAWLTLDQQRPALAHELCHALQDARFRLRRLVGAARSTDARLARQALVEGDCMAAMLEYMVGRGGPDPADLGQLSEAQLRRLLGLAPAPTGDATAAYLGEMVAFPFLAGLRLVLQVRQRHPWSLINKMFRRPPRSAEQVLHYRKYWRKEKPASIRAPAPELLKGHALLRQDTLGEFVLRRYLLGADPGAEAWARRAAAGWGGDRLLAFAADGAAESAKVMESAGKEGASKGGAGKGGPPSGAAKGAAGVGKVSKDGDGILPLLIHLTHWDSDLDAREFSNAQRRLWHARGLVSLGEPDLEAGRWRYRDPQKRTWIMRLRGRNLLSLMALPGELDSLALEQQVLDRFRVRGRRP